MCEYCGCQAIAAIELLTREHERALDHVRAVTAALRAEDQPRALEACAALAALLGPHTAVEERALFPAMHSEFPEHVSALRQEHRRIEAAIGAALDPDERPPGWQQELSAALVLLREHILKEQDGVFPGALGILRTAQWDELERVRHEVGTALVAETRIAP
ncbi:MAG: hemerythrin domain-containing protein [Mycobacteriales bacterium]